MTDMKIMPFDVDTYLSLPQAVRAHITEQAAEIERLRMALKTFADCCDQIDASEDDEAWAKFRPLIGDYRRARAALSKSEQQQ